MIHYLLVFALSLTCLPVMAFVGPIPQDENLFHTSLSNGVQLYYKHNEDLEHWACLRAIFCYNGEEHALFSFDSTEEDWEGIDEFLFACEQEVENPGLSHAITKFPTSFSALANKKAPRQLGIIAIGNFSKNIIEEKVTSHFAHLQLASSNSSLTIESSEEIDPAHVAINISFPQKHSLVTFEDLSLSWKQLFFQEVFQQRFEECTKRMNEIWIHPHPQGIYPASGYALVPEEKTRNMLSFFLWHLEMLRDSGVCDDSFSLKKQELLYRLSYMHAHQNHPASTLFASYCSDLFLLGASNLHFPSFIAASLNEVEQLTEGDLAPLFSSFLDKNNQFLHLAYSTYARVPFLTEDSLKAIEQEVSNLSHENDKEETVEEDPFFQFAFTSSPLLCSSKEDDSTPQFVFAAATPSSFYKLPLNSKEQEMITSIITTMAENNIFQLAMHKTTLEKKGKKIDHVHPLRFMGHILSNPVLKTHVKTIRKSSFKWDALISGFSKKMREQMGRNNVYPHLDGFAALVGTTKEQITPYIQKSDFEGLVKSLL